VASACEAVDAGTSDASSSDSIFIELEEVAQVFAMLPLESSHLEEVFDAVSSSSENGYDEEYTMKNLFECPGSGVGDELTRSSKTYAMPLRDMIEEYMCSGRFTKATTDTEVDDYLQSLMESDVQIYWPFSEDWDGMSLPIITFDPEDGSEVNYGYRLTVSDDGFRRVEEVLVDEEMACKEPVWIVNRNSDAGYTSLEMLRREDPDWGEGGGNIIVRPRECVQTKSGEGYKTLVLRDFKMNRNFDSWFAGASEFFVLTITGGCSFA
jgi:hypothetical protein